MYAATLEPEQASLLVSLVEASRSVAGDRRRPFQAVRSLGDPLALIFHPGFSDTRLRAYMGDIDALAELGLLRITQSDSAHRAFDVSNYGYAYYKTIHDEEGDSGQRLTDYVKRHLDTESFRGRYPRAFERWERAEVLLWSSDSISQLTTIGHFCREAVQELATVLVDTYQPQAVTTDVKKTVARLRAVLGMHSDRMGETEKAFAEALVAYWGAVNDLIQRQEHGGQMEGEGLTWEDGRRLVFQTANVMFEIDRTVTRAGNKGGAR